MLSPTTLKVLNEGRELLAKGHSSSNKALFTRGGRGSTINRTQEIIRSLSGSGNGNEDDNEDLHRSSNAIMKERLRLGQLYGVGTKRVKKLKAKKKKVYNDERDFNYNDDDEVEALKRIRGCLLLQTEGVSAAEKETYAKSTLFECMLLLEKALGLELSQRQTAALVCSMDAVEGVIRF